MQTLDKSKIWKRRPTNQKEPSPKNGFNFFAPKNSGVKTSKNRAIYKSRKTEQKSSNFKVFKPTREDITKEKIKTTIGIGRIGRFFRGEKNSFLFGFRTMESLKQQAIGFKPGNIWKNLNFYVVKTRILEQFNRFMAIAVTTSILLFITYLALFDRYFLVKTYTVNFEKNSYLSDTEVEKMLDYIRQDKFLGFFPNNQFWFINSRAMTASSQQVIPEIEFVEVQKRLWPHGAILKITTEPILITLAIEEEGQTKYWRVTQSGRILTQDLAGLKDNLVRVRRFGGIIAESTGKNQPERKALTLQDYSFEQDQIQLNRFWFVIWLWEQLNNYGIKVTNTSFPSLVDTDVIMETNRGTKMLFNSEEMSKEIQRKRIAAFWNSKILAQDATRIEKEGRIAYIDFRLTKKIIICYRGQECEKKTF